MSCFAVINPCVCARELLGLFHQERRILRPKSSWKLETRFVLQNTVTSDLRNIYVCVYVYKKVVEIQEYYRLFTPLNVHHLKFTLKLTAGHYFWT